MLIQSSLTWERILPSASCRMARRGLYGKAEMICIESALNHGEALWLILTLRRPRAAWSDFTRTQLTLGQKNYFRIEGLANQSAGGKLHGCGNSFLPA